MATIAPGPRAQPTLACPDPHPEPDCGVARTPAGPALLGPAQLRALADRLGLRPTKRLGQNFVHDANTVRRIVAAAKLTADDWCWRSGLGWAR